MRLTELEKNCLRVALQYSISDYETNLEEMVLYYGFDAKDIKEQRQLVRGMQRIQTKLLNEFKEIS